MRARITRVGAENNCLSHAVAHLKILPQKSVIFVVGL